MASLAALLAGLLTTLRYATLPHTTLYQTTPDYNIPHLTTLHYTIPSVSVASMASLAALLAGLLTTLPHLMARQLLTALSQLHQDWSQIVEL